jgi:hypothetical protein
VREVFDYYREKIQPQARLCPAEKIKRRLETFSVEELKAGVDRFAADAWWMENNAQRGAPWFFHSDARSEQFLNLKPRSPERNGIASGPSPSRPEQQRSSWDNGRFRFKRGGEGSVEGADDGR